MPATALKGYEIQVTGSNAGTWGDVLNDNVIQYIDDNLAGITTLSLSSSNVTLSASQARMCMLRCTGTLTANITITNANNGIYCVENLTSGAFSLTISDGTTTLDIPQSRRCLVYRDATNGPRVIGIAGSAVAGGAGDPIPVATVMLFYQNAAPAGWTINSSINDHALKIVSSSGGVQSGSVDYSTLFARTAVDGHANTVNEMPSHGHGVTGGVFGSSSANAINVSGGSGGNNFVASGITIANNGGGAAHVHNVDMRVKTAAVILAAKN